MSLLLTLLGLAAPAWSQPYLPPTRAEVSGRLGTTGASGQAQGVFRLTRRGLHLEVQGLLPGGVYTVHLVRVSPYLMEGVGPPPHDFTADGSGCAVVEATFVRDPISAWDLLVVKYHAGGDPLDRRGNSVLQAVLSRRSTWINIGNTS